MQLQTIQNKIYEIRGLKVMLDFDLAVLYDVENRALKQSVKRNIDRFPADFMFQLNKKEWQELITICDNLPEGIKYSPATPFAFTEQGVSMLSTVLRSKKAIAVNIAIMRIFVAIRQYALTHKDLSDKLKEIEKKYDKKFEDINEVLTYLLTQKSEQRTWDKRKEIGFKK